MYDHNCKLCDLHETAKTVCMEASGEPEWPGIVVGEAPGANEDDVGRPFVGRAGRVLDRALCEATNMTPKSVRQRLIVTNAVKCRPPNNATPTAQQLDTCVRYLEQEIEAWDPRAILALGNVATITLIGTGGISALRGGEHYLNRARRPCLFLPFHPAFVLRQGYDSDAAEMFKADVADFIRYIRRRGER